MRGVILAGGTGSRLSPLTKVTNKHLLPVGNRPMLFHSVEKLTESGIKQIMVVTGIEHAGSIISALGSGKDFDCQFTYKVQDEAGGIAQALGLAEEFCKDEKFCVILGDNIFEDSLQYAVNTYDKLRKEGTAYLLLKEVPDPTRYGVVEFDVNNQIVSIVEKPKKPKSDYAVSGIYFYDSQVFDIIKTLKPSKRGELEITDVNNYYVETGRLDYHVLYGWWTDAGTFESLAKANELVRQ